MAKSRISTAKQDIVALLDDQPRPVFKHTELGLIFENNRDEWQLPRSMKLDEFLEYLRNNSNLKRLRLQLPHRPETLFVWREVSDLCIACAVKPKAYISHYSAMQFHELTDQVPEVIYVNHEQRPQVKQTVIPTQESIDRAFRGKQRMSKNIAPLGRKRICLLNGKHTGELGVVDAMVTDGGPIRVTGLERTLIDITVRPSYSGGVSEVLEAFRRAADRVQVNSLIATLRKIDFVYPYEQAIGFYMEHSGAYDNRRLELLEKGGFNLEFYLTYGMKSKEHSSRWRIFYPSGL